MTILKAHKLIRKLTRKLLKENKSNKIEIIMIKIDILRDFINFELDYKDRT